MARASKRMKSAYEGVDREKLYSVEEAVKILKGKTAVKFDETVEVSMNLNVDPRHADQMVRGVISLPNGTGKNVRVAVFAKDAKAEEAKAAGADIVGAEDLVAEIQKGNIDFDRCIASPDMMAMVGRVAKVLGPKGMMPNPKLGSVTPDVAKAVKDAKGGQVEYRAEKAGVVHAGVGKMSFAEDKVIENVHTFINTILKARPSGAKGKYVKSVTLTTSMGPGLKLNVADSAQ